MRSRGPNCRQAAKGLCVGYGCTSFAGNRFQMPGGPRRLYDQRSGVSSRTLCPETTAISCVFAGIKSGRSWVFKVATLAAIQPPQCLPFWPFSPALLHISTNVSVLPSGPISSGKIKLSAAPTATKFWPDNKSANSSAGKSRSMRLIKTLAWLNMRDF